MLIFIVKLIIMQVVKIKEKNGIHLGADKNLSINA